MRFLHRVQVAMSRKLTKELLRSEALLFSSKEVPLTDKRDGKSIGTHVEKTFFAYLQDRGYVFRCGKASSGLDFPDLGVDIKTAARKNRTTSGPFKSFHQAVFGLGYDLLLFTYAPVLHFVPADGYPNGMPCQMACITGAAYFERPRDRALGKQLAAAPNDEMRVHAMRKRYPAVSLAEAAEVVGKLTPELLTEFAAAPASGVSLTPALQWRIKYH